MPHIACELDTFALVVVGRWRGVTDISADVGSRTFAVSGQDKLHELPEDVDVSLVTARSQQLDATSGIIRFFPDGSSTGGRVSLARGSRRYHVDVNWLTGHVTIRDE